MTTQRLGPQQLDRLRTTVSERDLAIVRRVAELRLMSTAQIQDLYFGPDHHASSLTAARTCRRVLERLVTLRVLVRLDRRVGGIRAGSSSFVYAIGPVGQRLIELDGPRRRFKEPSTTFADHTLAVGQMVVELSLAASRGSCELLEIETEPHCWRRFAGGGSGQVLRPDLFVIIGLGEFEHRWFIEIDRGHEHVPTVVRKCRIYEAYYRTGTEQAAHGVSPRTCWVVPDRRRATRLRRAIGGARELTDRLFTVAVADVAVDTLTGGGA